MRAILLSDSHGMGEGLKHLLERAWKEIGPGKVDAYIHCGDGAQDLERCREFILAHDPGAQLHAVRGNCDFGVYSVPEDEVFTLGGERIYLCHGHRYRVKSSLMYLEYAAIERECSIALYGHTHIPDEQLGRVMMFNPGSAKDGRFALLQVGEGLPRVRIYNLDGRQMTWH